MWLLTQDKECLVNLNNFDVICASDAPVGSVVLAHKVGERNSSVVIGKYEGGKDAYIIVQDIAQFIKDSKSLPFSDDDIVYFTK